MATNGQGTLVTVEECNEAMADAADALGLTAQDLMVISSITSKINNDWRHLSSDSKNFLLLGAALGALFENIARSLKLLKNVQADEDDLRKLAAAKGQSIILKQQERQDEFSRIMKILPFGDAGEPQN